ncbi:MAG TPA: hypothetical protein PKO39_06815 [Bacilli bacterium]|jgi:hypothetical protein|nr:hypothetical protein [Acholeplasmataceae bacterium]HOA79145.1 hypothetical protein [Bacilli bacterium]HPZ27835.1 hypothetical protein [Bacilli bacterium]
MNENVTVNDKKLYYIVIGLGLFAILLVILLSIPWGGDKKAIMKEYESLTSKDHVFKSIKYQDLMERIERGETFQVYIGSNELEEANQFVYEVNKIAKEFNVKTIYYLRLNSLSTAELTNIKIESDMNISFPTLIYWEGDNASRSVAHHISSLKDPSYYDYNWFVLLTEYFEQCFEE